ncbi:porin [Paraburkholderia sp. BCC1886]|uniref:porin n=1 Tax=Paraburkholderia sp. BCC1886 TaxID=2562670 RepID=UPI0011841180|nr:porin [Paraburkholderia sp. BCC1886]
MKRVSTLALACALTTGYAHAQVADSDNGNSVTLFGLLDAGILYVPNQAGHGTTAADSGMMAPDLFGVTGTENLGGGTRAIFKLVSQFNLTNGTTIPGPGTLFSREAYVGLQNPRYGTLTLGDQYDVMTDELLSFDASLYFGTFYDARQGPFAALRIPNNPSGSSDFDHVSGSMRISNAVKYKTPVSDGLSLTALYGFGDVAGSISADSTYGFGADYSNGPIAIGAAYSESKYAELNNGHDGIRTFGMGAHYAFSHLTVYLLYTNTRNTLTRAAVNVYEVSESYRMSPVLTFGASYQYMQGNAQLTDNHATQVATTLRYALSKRTTLSFSLIYQHAAGDLPDTNAWINTLQPSSSSTQMLVRAGISTVF